MKMELEERMRRSRREAENERKTIQIKNICGWCPAGPQQDWLVLWCEIEVWAEPEISLRSCLNRISNTSLRFIEFTHSKFFKGVESPYLRPWCPDA